MKRPSLLPYFALAAGISALSLSAIFVRWAAAPGPVMSFYRLGFATLLMAPILLYARWKARRSSNHVSQTDRPGSPIPWRWSWLIFPLLGGVFTSLDHAIWSTALGYTAVATATLLNNTAPLWVALFALFVFRERLSGLFWTGLALTLTGAALVLGYDFLLHPNTLGWGDLLSLFSGLFYAGYFLATQAGRRRLDTLLYVWLATLIGALMLLGISLSLGLPLTGYSPQAYLAFLGAALISQVGGYLSVSYALGHLPASVVSPTMIAQPVLTAFLALVLLGEGLNPAQGIGGLAVLVGVYFVHRSREQSSRSPGSLSGVEPTPAEAAQTAGD